MLQGQEKAGGDLSAAVLTLLASPLPTRVGKPMLVLGTGPQPGQPSIADFKWPR